MKHFYFPKPAIWIPMCLLLLTTISFAQTTNRFPVINEMEDLFGKLDQRFDCSRGPKLDANVYSNSMFIVLAVQTGNTNSGSIANYKKCTIFINGYSALSVNASVATPTTGPSEASNYTKNLPYIDFELSKVSRIRRTANGDQYCDVVYLEIKNIPAYVLKASNTVTIQNLDMYVDYGSVIQDNCTFDSDTGPKYQVSNIDYTTPSITIPTAKVDPFCGGATIS